MFLKGQFVVFLSLLILSTAPVCAATQTMSVSVAFDEMLRITNATGLDFGYLKANQAGTYTLSTTGVVTATKGGIVLGGAKRAGSLTLSGSSAQTVDISATNYVASNGVTPSNATCSYGGGAASSCNMTSQAAPGAGKTLLVGVTIDVDGKQGAGTSAAPSFDIVVTYH